MKTPEEIANYFALTTGVSPLCDLSDLIREIADAIRQARIDALEEACKAVCSICYRGVTVCDYEGTAAHPMVSVDDGRTINWYCRCAAYEIRQLIAREKESK